MALARKGDFRGAELIYRAEAERFLSPDRRHEMAAIYLEFADAYFHPPKDDQKPDYVLALEFYLKALETGPKTDKRTEVELLAAQCRQKMGKQAEAANAYAKFIADYPNSPLDLEARYRLGECRLAEGNRLEARRAWQALLARHAGAKSDLVAEAAFHLARTWRIPRPANHEELTQGVAALAAFLDRFPTHALAGQAHLEIADSYFHAKRHEDRTAALDRFLKDDRYKDRKEYPQAWDLLGSSYCVQKKYPEALAVWREYLVKFPSQDGWNNVQKEIIHTEYQVALEKYKAKDYAAATKLLAEFLAKYPLDARAPGILYLFGQINHQQKKWDAALADWRRLVSKYPRAEEAAQAQLMIARVLEQELGKPEEALEEYRKVSGGRPADDARQSLTRLTAPSMAVATERVFRSDETPSVKLTTRNLESVTVRVYKVDLETYFRKMHDARGIEKLDISLIDPDRTVEFNVPGFAKHRQIESAVPLPLPDGANAGVLAVTVSSPTLEATTLVIQSDLEILVKSSPGEVFVFAENLRTGKPWAGARLLVSNGKQVFLEGVTGEGGVLQKACRESLTAAAEASSEPEANEPTPTQQRMAPGREPAARASEVPSDVRVFAVMDGHVACNVVGLPCAADAQKTSDKGYLYTDRPSYEPGETVRVRGCVRQAVGDGYAVPQGRKYTLEVFDGRKRMFWREDVALSPFGSFQAQLVLPVTSRSGHYRLTARDDAGHTCDGVFQVQRRQVEPIRLAIEAPRKLCYRGDSLEGTIRATTYFGAPLVGREVRYQLANEGAVLTKTDAKGEVRVKLPTRDFDASQTLTLTAALTVEDVQTSETFTLAAEGFAIQMSTARPVFLAGEPVDVLVKTRDAADGPVSETLAMKVFELYPAEGRIGERLLEEHPVTTAANGTARQTLKLPRGGRYQVRVEGTDRFKNPIASQLNLRISGDESQERLLVLADQTALRAGDTAGVRVHWRGEPALALVTCEGAKVLEHKLVELARGDNKVSLPTSSKLAPEFTLSVAAMRDRRLHIANARFTVRRDLQVKVACQSKREAAGAIRPGDTIEVTITTSNPQGKPVAAEVGLAMVRQSLLGNLAASVAPIQQFVHGPAPIHAIHTGSSIEFSYRPATGPAAVRTERQPGGDSEDEAVTDQPSADQPSDAMQPRNRFGREFTGATSPDFQNLLETIASTVKPETWEEFDRSRREELGEPRERPVPVRPSARPKAKPATEDDPPEDSFTAEPSANSARRAAAVAGSDSASAISYWNPAIVTGADGRATVSVTLPEEPGDWALVAKGITAETLAGETIEKLSVKKDLTGDMRLPTAATAGDELDVPIAVQNDVLEKGPIEVTLKTTIGGRTIEQKKTIDVQATGNQELQFKVALGKSAPVPLSLRERAGVRVRDEKTPPFPPVAKQSDGRTSPLSRPNADHPHPNPLRAPTGGWSGEGTISSPAVFELTIVAGSQRDVVRRTIPILPHGAPSSVGVGGSATGDATAWIAAPKDAPMESVHLRVLLSPTIEQCLFDTVTESCPTVSGEATPAASEVETAATDLLASLALQKLPGAARNAAGPQAKALDYRIRAALGLSVLAQNDDGGWGWTGDSGSNHCTSARAVWAISLARHAGYLVSDRTFQSAVEYLRRQAANTDNADFEGKAMLLHALTAAGQGDFALANHLHRERASLSPAALGYLASSLTQMDRRAMAVEVLRLLAEKDLEAPVARRARASAPWPHSTVEIHSLELLAIQQAGLKSPRAEKLADWLLPHCAGRRWLHGKAIGPAVMALCARVARDRVEAGPYKLTVSVNGKPLEVLEIEPSSAGRAIEVPAGLLTKDKQRIDFRMTGRGRYVYQCVLSGTVPAEKVKATAADWDVQRTYQPPCMEFDGRPVPRGFGIVEGEVAKFVNTMTQLPAGRRGWVELKVRCKTAARPAEGEAAEEKPRSDDPFADPLELAARRSQESQPYLVVSEPIPAGAMVIESSISGGFDRVEILPGRLVFCLGSHDRRDSIVYALDGCLPGTYRAGPTVVRGAYRPDRMAVGGPASLVVLPQGAAASDPYRLSPEELFALGRLLKEKGDLKVAAARLGELVEKWKLQSRAYRQAVNLLLDIHLELGPPAKVVQYFEIVKEKWPDQDVPFANALRVGAAYRDIGEFERAYLICRATVEGSFTRESGVPGFLEEHGEYLRSVAVMGRLAREYPPEPYVAEAELALAQGVYAKAPEAAADPKLRKQKITRSVLVRRAWQMFESLLTAQPLDPATDQAAFAAANTLLDLKDYPRAAAAATRYARQFPQSELLDSYWYVTAYGEFAAGRHQAAVETCRKVAEARRLDKTSGRTVESVNKWRAIYILGQIYQSLGQATDAIRQYRRVEDRFADAKLSIAHFLRKSIELPEVTTIKPGGPGEVELKFRNIASCNVKVYRVDLMKFGLLAGQQDGISQINLSGIRPLTDTEIKLGDGRDYRDRTQKLPLGVAKEGAYLVVCRGEDLHASGLVLVTPLAVEVQTDPASRQVRAMVKDVTTDRYVSGVQVKVLGRLNTAFVSGRTDLRGMFVADDIRGAATVIVQGDAGRAAFYRAPPQPSDAGGFADWFMQPPRPAIGPDRAAQPGAGPTPGQSVEDVFATRRTRRQAEPKPDEVAKKPAEPADNAAADTEARGLSESHKQIEKALDSPTKIDLIDAHLTDMLDYLAKQHHIEIQLDHKGIDDAGMKVDDLTVTRKLQDISLRSALRLILRDFQLTYVIQDEVVLITTPETAEARVMTIVYPVADLVKPSPDAGDGEADYDSLIEAITSTVQPTTWDTVGGPGGVNPFPNKSSLIISQTQEVHEEIADLLANLRSVGKKKTAGAESARVKRTEGEGQPAAQDTPPRPPRRRGPPVGQSFGGMGGMGVGGMGGFGGRPGGKPAEAAPDLLEDVKNSNRANQGKQTERLKSRYKSGMGMGGMGGMGAGGLY